MLNRVSAILASFILIFLLAGFVNGEDYIDRVVAVVNDDVITLSELEETGRNFFERIRAQAPAGEMERALEKA